ncbi:MAG: 50S ribosomal protein L17 [Candidatus Paceibacterota bacterium]
MKHGIRTRKLGRIKSQREALMRSLSRSLIQNERITTTTARAKSLRPYVEKLVTKARENTLANRRGVKAQLGNDEESTKKLFSELGPRFANRPGGYTRITKLAPRKSDASPQAIIEFVEQKEE